MIELNINEINKYGIKKQPIEYNSEEELIKWLKYNLLQQALGRNKKPDENNIITITDEEEKDYILNIGREVWDMEYYINIHFDFSFNNLQVLLYGNNDNIKSNYRINTDYIIFHEEACFYNLKNCYRFREVTFHKKVSFYENEFLEEIKFDNVVFYKEVNFLLAYFYKKVSFSGTYFYDYVCLSSFFYDEVNFYGITIKKEMYFYTNNDKIENIIFSGIIFENQKSMLYIGSINKVNNFSFVNTAINGQLELNNIGIEEADFKGTIINGGYINPVNFKVHKFANRESALFLKQQAYARNNAIDALEYKAKEVEKHKEDLINDWKKNKNLKTFGDILSIELSSLYSDNGQNWMKALAMTILITAFCFTIFYMPDVFYIDKIFNEENYISLYFSSYKNVFNNLIKYLIPTDYDLIKDYTKLYINYSNTPLCDIVTYLAVKIFGVLVYFLGKVLFWYGSVQTVQAFRKFAKGA